MWLGLQHTQRTASGHKRRDWNRVTPTCSQALLHLFQVLLQALLLNEQAVVLRLKLLDPAAAHSMGQPAWAAPVAPTGSNVIW